MTDPLAQPLDLARGPAMPNRFMLAPLTNQQSHADGTLSDDEYHWLTKRAEGGFGLTMTCAAHVSREGQGFPGQLGIWSDAHLPGLSRLAASINAQGGVSSVQLQHSGRRARADVTGLAAVCPWDDAETGARALSTAEIEQVIEDFIAAAVRAEKAGFHGVELHGAHGYLLGQFLDADNNHRTDSYGGSFDDRCRVLLTTIEGVRARTGPAFQLGVRISPERFGISIEESRALAERLMTGGDIDYLDLSLWDVAKLPVEEAHRDKPLIAHFMDLPRGRTRLGVAGKILDARTARRCLDEGADYVLIGRGAILHHDFPRLALADPDFAVTARPVTRDYLRNEGLGEAFIDYVAAGWKDFVREESSAA
ncbi:MAG: NADH:flavin oxidoreductase [Sphingobium sp.]